jgi:hypothetical protein
MEELELLEKQQAACLTSLEELATKQGKKTRTVNVVEAKLVCPNGFAISPGTEWIKNEGNMDGNLKTVWEQVYDALTEKTENEKTHFLFRQKEYLLKQKIRRVNGLTYKLFTLNWVECVESETKKTGTKQIRFVHLSSMPVDDDSAVNISRHARMR